jgi:hypothetical protein
LPSLATSSLFSPINPGTPFEVGPFSIIPVAADNAGDQPGLSGSVIYVIKAGPELNLSVSGNTVRIDITKGKKQVFAEDLQVSEKDSKKLLRYLQENFAA